jgi:hypothetical protein
MSTGTLHETVIDGLGVETGGFGRRMRSIAAESGTKLGRSLGFVPDGFVVHKLPRDYPEEWGCVTVVYEVECSSKLTVRKLSAIAEFGHNAIYWGVDLWLVVVSDMGVKSPAISCDDLADAEEWCPKLGGRGARSFLYHTLRCQSVADSFVTTYGFHPDSLCRP